MWMSVKEWTIYWRALSVSILKQVSVLQLPESTCPHREMFVTLLHLNRTHLCSHWPQRVKQVWSFRCAHHQVSVNLSSCAVDDPCSWMKLEMFHSLKVWSVRSWIDPKQGRKKNRLRTPWRRMTREMQRRGERSEVPKADGGEIWGEIVLNCTENMNILVLCWKQRHLLYVLHLIYCLVFVLMNESSLIPNSFYMGLSNEPSGVSN